MKNELREPETLQDAINFFSEPDNCLGYLIARRWPDGVECPTCGATDVRFITTRRMWECKNTHPRKQFSVKVGSIMEDSAIGLDKWLVAMWLVANCKNGISSYELHRTIGVTQKSAWFMLHRIRLAMQDDMGKIGGGGTVVEADETFVGGKLKNMHKNRKPKLASKRRGGVTKTVVVGMLERQGRVKAEVVVERTQPVLQALVRKHIAPGSTLMTDEWGGYKGSDFAHEIINHANEYVNGLIHTNGIENFWSLLKRELNGTYISVEPFHLFRYIDEQAFRYNNRGGKKKENRISDFDRFSLLSASLANKRLTYAELTGKVSPTCC
jgi:transposase-like protein